MKKKYRSMFHRSLLFVIGSVVKKKKRFETHRTGQRPNFDRSCASQIHVILISKFLSIKITPISIMKTYRYIAVQSQPCVNH